MFLGIKLEGSDPAGEIKSNIWQSLNIIRGALSTSDFHIVLLLLVLQKKGLLNRLTHSSPVHLKFELEQAVHGLDWETERPLMEVFNFYEPIFRRIHDTQIFELIHLFRSFDRDTFENHFA
ncbi:MAG: hypothetical protein EOO07_31110, partial [Chitinophagaceae bacterium]